MSSPDSRSSQSMLVVVPRACTRYGERPLANLDLLCGTNYRSASVVSNRFLDYWFDNSSDQGNYINCRTVIVSNYNQFGSLINSYYTCKYMRFYHIFHIWDYYEIPISDRQKKYRWLFHKPFVTSWKIYNYSGQLIEYYLNKLFLVGVI